MKPRLHFLPIAPAALATAIGCLILLLQVARANAAGPAPGKTLAKTGVGEAPVTQSVFILPHYQAEGRDPFFPRSTSVYTRYNTVPQTNQTVVVTAELRLKGISGSPEKRLAIVNNKTFEVGVEGDVISGPDRIRIR